ncbi:hypothetical protein [Microcoleus sp.]|uniref:hypothetical protein n=1 Tax=Microcoleus sp. TaxID=44472 RepID=UPI0035234439
MSSLRAVNIDKFVQNIWSGKAPGVDRTMQHHKDLQGWSLLAVAVTAVIAANFGIAKLNYLSRSIR